MTEPERHRRDVLRAIGVGSIATLAGCSGEDEEGKSTAEADEEGGEETTSAQEPEEDMSSERKPKEEGETTYTLEVSILSEDRSPEPDAKITGQTKGRSFEFETPRTDENGRTQVELPEATYHTFDLYECSANSCSRTMGEFLNVFPSDAVTDDGQGIRVTQDTRVTIRNEEQEIVISP